MAKMIKGKKWGLAATLLIGALFVFLPLGSATEFSFRDGGKGRHSLAAYRWILQQPDFLHYLGLSLELALLTAVITLLLVVPTVVWLHLRAESLRPLIEFLTILPLVIPVVALSIGAQTAFPSALQSTQFELPLMYVILALPYSFRALDIGIRAIPLKTISEAARGLGANWPRTIFYVIAPVMRSAVVGASFLTLALSLGEFTLTSLLHWDTFPTWVTTVSQQSIIGAIALSVFSLGAAFFLLFTIGLVTTRSKRQAMEAVE